MLIVGVGFLAFWILGYFKTVSPNVQAPLVAGLFASGVALANWNYQRRKDELERHKEKKVEVYGQLFDLLYNLQKENKKFGTEHSDKFLKSEKFLDLYWAIGRDLTLWASPGVIRAYYNSFKGEETQNTAELLKRWDNLYGEMRKDLGLSNRGLKPFDLIGIMVNDIEQLRAVPK